MSRNEPQKYRGEWEEGASLEEGTTVECPGVGMCVINLKKTKEGGGLE